MTNVAEIVKITHLAEIVNIGNVARILESKICGIKNMHTIPVYNQQFNFLSQHFVIRDFNHLQMRWKSNQSNQDTTPNFPYNLGENLYFSITVKYFKICHSQNLSQFKSLLWRIILIQDSKM